MSMNWTVPLPHPTTSIPPQKAWSLDKHRFLQIPRLNFLKVFSAVKFIRVSVMSNGLCTFKCFDDISTGFYRRTQARYGDILFVSHEYAYNFSSIGLIIGPYNKRSEQRTSTANLGQVGSGWYVPILRTTRIKSIILNEFWSKKR